MDFGLDCGAVKQLLLLSQLVKSNIARLKVGQSGGSSVDLLDQTKVIQGGLLGKAELSSIEHFFRKGLPAFDSRWYLNSLELRPFEDDCGLINQLLLLEFHVICAHLIKTLLVLLVH